MDLNEQTNTQQDDASRHLNEIAAVGENMVG